METCSEKYGCFMSVLEFSAISILCSWGSREALNSKLCLFHACTLAEGMCAYVP